ncbi:unnamed protein product [Rotaria sp. Silwood1]|nr:unnamed protein product [Rotaria sp. Silwood1]CAF3434590.1 unnamed protein product [Rotaria sp. Silwood1]CAF3447016.1 unnamed protein product [Rotaria sp. Silwood1]CAF4902740.1 unnamed protein product [Rotaria sp. Silwood1]CAF4922778.1 unnamed protein product [Rotaria sp. Silwood1]
MLTHHSPTNFKQQLSNDHDLTELSWLTRSDIFDQRSSNSVRHLPKLSQSLPTYVTSKEDIPRHHHSSPSSLIDSSDSEHDNDSSSLNSSSERVPTTTNLTDIVSPPHSALCFWILFAIEESKTRSLTLNEICDWIERHIEQQQIKTINPISSDEQLIRSARLKSKIRYHMTKQISFFVKIIKDPVSGIKLRYPLWTTDRLKRQLLLDTLLTMNTRQLSLYTQYTIDIYERLCSERRLTLTRNTNDENSCPTLLKHNTKRDKTIHRLGSSEESNNTHKRKKQQSKNDSSITSIPSVEVVDAAMTLLLLRKPK